MIKYALLLAALAVAAPASAQEIVNNFGFQVAKVVTTTASAGWSFKVVPQKGTSSCLNKEILGTYDGPSERAAYGQIMMARASKIPEEMEAAAILGWETAHPQDAPVRPQARGLTIYRIQYERQPDTTCVLRELEM